MREYQKRYYHAHKEKAAAYQKIYGQKVRRSAKKEKVAKPKLAFNSSTFVHAPTEKSIRMIEWVLSGKAVMVL